MFRWNKLSLRNQFLFLFIVILLLVLGLVFYYFTWNQKEFYLEQLKVTLNNEGKLIMNNNKVNITIHNPDKIDNWVKKWGQKIETRITIIDKDGRVLADSTYAPDKMDNHAGRPEIKKVLNGAEQGSNIRGSKTLGKEMFYYALPIRDQQTIIGVMRLSKSLNDINRIIKKNIRSYLLFMVLILIVTVLVIWKFTSSLVNPLSRMTEMARSIAHGNFQKRIQLKSYENEIGIMARMFNFMADQLEYKIDEISEEKNRAEAILSSMADGVIATDRNREIMLINPAAREMLNLDEIEVKDRDIIEIVRHYRVDKSLQISLDNNETFAEEIAFKNPDKKIFRCQFAPITDEDSKVIGGVVVFTDITELRRLEKVRKDFVANVSHELRTPLTSIIGYVDTLLESDIDDPEISKKFLSVIKTEADRLALLIKDLMNLSRVEEDTGPNLRPEELKNIIEKTITILQDSAAEKSISIKVEGTNDLPLVQMIPEQIEQVLINLVDNSIKYTPKGGEVVIRAETVVDKVFIEVEDNGIGIPGEEQERIFERFYRVDKARSRSLGGTGIGLSIVKHIIQGHDSEIEVKSLVGEGTVFRFYLRKAK